MAVLDRFYLITGSAALLERLVPLGVRLVQLRVKDLSPEALRGEAIRAQAACRRHGAQLILNDHWRLALDLGIDFVHLGQEDLDAADIPALRRAGAMQIHEPRNATGSRGVRQCRSRAPRPKET